LWLVKEARSKIISGEFYNWKKIMVNRLGQRL
jgi:queuine tRNA-ribosyltransferase